MAEKSLGLLAANRSNSWTGLHGAWLDTSVGRARILLVRAARGAAAKVERQQACDLFQRSAAAPESLDAKGQVPAIERSSFNEAGGRGTRATRAATQDSW